MSGRGSALGWRWTSWRVILLTRLHLVLPFFPLLKKNTSMWQMSPFGSKSTLGGIGQLWGGLVG